MVCKLQTLFLLSFHSFLVLSPAWRSGTHPAAGVRNIAWNYPGAGGFGVFERYYFGSTLKPVNRLKYLNNGNAEENAKAEAHLENDTRYGVFDTAQEQ